MRRSDSPLRGLYATPILGRVAREVIEGDRDNKWYLAVAFLALYAIAGMTWGLPALVMPFILAGPICIAMLVAISRG